MRWLLILVSSFRSSGQNAKQWHDTIIPCNLTRERFQVQARTDLRLVACVSETARDRGYEFALTFEGLGFSSSHLDMQVLSQELNTYNQLILIAILIKIWRSRHTIVSETAL